MRGEAYAHVIGELTEVRPNINANGIRELWVFLKVNPKDYFTLHAYSENQHRFIESHLRRGDICSARCALETTKSIPTLRLIRIQIVARPGQPDPEITASPTVGLLVTAPSPDESPTSKDPKEPTAKAKPPTPAKRPAAGHNPPRRSRARAKAAS